MTPRSVLTKAEFHALKAGDSFHDAGGEVWQVSSVDQIERDSNLPGTIKIVAVDSSFSERVLVWDDEKSVVLDGSLEELAQLQVS
jgi:hypothetical protein